MPLETIILFFTASMALAFVPGPDNIFVLTQSALHGRKAGLLVTLGLCTGLLFHTAAVSFGVAVIFQTSALAFNILKFVGAAYLVYLAYQAFKSSSQTIDSTKKSECSAKNLYFRGVIMNITNPKVAIFFIAFLPQFADASLGPITYQMITFGFFFIIATFLVFGSIAWFAGFIGDWLKNSEKAQVVMNKMAGVVFIGLAARLAITEQAS